MTSGARARWIAETFDARAATYDESAMHRWQAEGAVRLLDPQPGERVLDVAAGTGLAARLVADAVGPSGVVVGVDLSERMLRAGPGRWSRVRADAHRLPFSDASFGAVVCVSAVPYFTDLDRVLDDWHRVLVPGGRVVLTVPAADGITGHRLLRQAAAEHGLVVANPHAAVGREDALRARLAPQGLGVERVEVGTFPDTLADDPHESFAEVVGYGLAEEVRIAPTDQRAAVRDTYVARYLAARGRAEQRWLFAQATRDALSR